MRQLNKNVAFNDGLSNRELENSQRNYMQTVAPAAPAAPPSNYGVGNTMNFNPMMGMPNMNTGYPYPPVQNPFFPQQFPINPAMSGFGTPPNAGMNMGGFGTPPGVGTGGFPQAPMNMPPQVQFPSDSAFPTNVNNSFDSTLDREVDAHIKVEDGKYNL